jgi:hypothetical protein
LTPPGTSRILAPSHRGVCSASRGKLDAEASSASACAGSTRRDARPAADIERDSK